MSKTLKKVIFKYSDGTSKSLEGKQAIKWDKYCEDLSVFAYIHGVNPPWNKLKWIEKTKK